MAQQKSINKIVLFVAIVIVIFWLLRNKKMSQKNTIDSNQPYTPTQSFTSFSSITTTPTNSQIVTSNIDLTGAAPTGAMFGINTNTGTMFFVNSLGDWQESTVPITTHTPLTGTFATVHLDNSQAFTSDVVIAGVILSNHYDLQVITSLESYPEIDVLMSVVADNRVRVTVRNNTGNTISVPELTISALQLN